MTMKALCGLCAIDGTRQALAEQVGGQPINAHSIAMGGLALQTEPSHLLSRQYAHTLIKAG